MPFWLFACRWRRTRGSLGGAQKVAKWFSYLERKPGPDSGLNEAWWLYHRSVARGSSKNPYLLANEWICSSLGTLLRLPIPPFALMRKAAVSQRYFASLDFGTKEVLPSDMDPKRLCECLPQLATGVVIFDIFIANPDRHEGNLKTDDPDQPTVIQLFDHDHALFGHEKGQGPDRLNKVSQDSLGLFSGMKR